MIRKFSGKNIFLGIGIGIILSTAVFIAFTPILNSMDSKNIYISDEEIIKRAKDLGMSFGFIQQRSEANNPSSQEKTDDISVKSQQQNSNQPNTDYIEIVIPSGYDSFSIAQILLDNDIIKDKKAFIERVDELGISRALNKGTYYFNKNITVDEIIQKLAR